MPSPTTDSNAEDPSKVTTSWDKLTKDINVDAESSSSGFVSSDDVEKKRFGRYVIQGSLGSGGFGRVYLAEDTDLKRLVALKIPKMSSRPYPAVLEAYKREAQTVAALELPGVVPIYDIGLELDGTIYFVSKYVRGSDLYALMERKAIDRATAVKLCEKVARTLHKVHLNSIIHRDIKPGNILIDDEGNPFVSDFGLALRPTEFGKTKGRTGTLSYMSPEQVRGESHLVDGRSDLFSLGVILYELLSGVRPFDGPDADTTMHCIQFIEPRPLRQIDDSIPIALERICMKVLSKKASDRYSTGADFASDLEYWAKGGPAINLESSHQTLQETPATIVPRGLRAFRGRDSAFFLDLLPGPRDRDGLPEIIQHWKTWIQEKSTEHEHRVGVIYGPSGCGKSSIIQAGIIPLLGGSVDIEMIQATDRFEEHLQRALRKHAPPLVSTNLNLEDLSDSQLVAHRREQLGAAGKPLLLVIDQFENWLLGCTAEEANRFAMTLRQCDGIATKALLLVRDDFWIALGRFMSVVDIPLIPDVNCSLVDLFDPGHAKRVLQLFGQAHRRLPSSDRLEPSHDQFLDLSIEGLTRSGKVYPVQLALFAEMLKGRPWLPKTLKEIGGVEGIGKQFLEDAFEAEHAPTKQRMHEPAARRVLGALLPNLGTDVRTRFQSREEIQELSGYASNPHAFRELMHILNNDLRLISPADRFESTSGSMTPSNDSYESFGSSEDSTFQLSHDFLIPSIREWVARKELETYRGRVKAQLTDFAGLWSAKYAGRFLPNWFEWIKFLLLIPRKSMTDDQLLMMRYATRRHLRNSAIAIALCALAFAALQSWRSSQQQAALIKQFESARFTEIPAIARQMQGLSGAALDTVSAISTNPKETIERRVAAEMVLCDHTTESLISVVNKSLSLTPEAVATVGNYFKDDMSQEPLFNSSIDAEAVSEHLWRVLEDESETNDRRLSAAQLLVRFGRYMLPKYSERRQEISRTLADILVDYCAFHPSHFSLLADQFSPALPNIEGRLLSTVGLAKPSLESSTATSLLIRFFRDDAKELTDISLDASPWQLRMIMPALIQHGNEVVPMLREVIRTQVRKQTADRGLTRRESIRIATAATLLARFSDSEPGIWNLLRLDPEPTLRCTMIHRFADVGVSSARLMNRLTDEQDESVIAAIFQALGQYPVPPKSTLTDETIERILSKAIGAKDPETMSSANWLARKWGIDDQLNSLLAAPSGGVQASSRWRTLSNGLVMVGVDGESAPNIGRVFEIATTEVSVEQFQQYFEYAYYEKTVSRTPDSPINIVKWHDALRFCRWLSEKEGIDESEMCYPPVDEIMDDFYPDADHVQRLGYRLPTVAEWQFACQAGTNGGRFFGENADLLSYYAVCADRYSSDLLSAEPCGTLKPNPLGLFDMFGNILEWTIDKSPGNDEDRELCGGSYNFNGDDMRASSTRGALPNTMFNSIGFRVVKSVSNSPKRTTRSNP